MSWNSSVYYELMRSHTLEGDFTLLHYKLSTQTLAEPEYTALLVWGVKTKNDLEGILGETRLNASRGGIYKALCDQGFDGVAILTPRLLPGAEVPGKAEFACWFREPPGDVFSDTLAPEERRQLVRDGKVVLDAARTVKAWLMVGSSQGACMVLVASAVARGWHIPAISWAGWLPELGTAWLEVSLEGVYQSRSGVVRNPHPPPKQTRSGSRRWRYGSSTHSLPEVIEPIASPEPSPAVDMHEVRPKAAHLPPPPAPDSLPRVFLTGSERDLIQESNGQRWPDRYGKGAEVFPELYWAFKGLQDKRTNHSGTDDNSFEPWCALINEIVEAGEPEGGWWSWIDSRPKAHLSGEGA